jgi:hypothetical protein
VNDPQDPRSRLANAPYAVGSRFAPAQYSRFDTAAPHHAEPGSRTWYSHASNFVVAWSDAQSGAVFAREADVDEQLLVLPDEGTVVEVSAGGERVRIGGKTVSFLPPGGSSVRVLEPGRIIRALTRRSAPDLFARCSDAARGVIDDPNAAPFQPWPAPPSGYRIRSYPMQGERRATAFGRVWRCSSFLVLYVEATRGARDPSKLSPHAHADFQQCCVVLEGEFSFNIRWPWVADKAAWRADEHETVAAPAVVMIPAQAIHTTQRLSAGVNYIFDIYAPPRGDFSAAGWAINGDDYPLPPGMTAADSADGA